MLTVGAAVFGEVSTGVEGVAAVAAVAAVGAVTGSGSGGMNGGCGEAVGWAVCARIRSSFRCCAWIAS